MKSELVLEAPVDTVKEFNKKIQEQFIKMAATGKLFRVLLSGTNLWQLYLATFKNDPVFRDPNSSEHNCNTCHSFVKRYGNIVAVDANNNLMSIFDVNITGEYAPVAHELSKAIKSYSIVDVFFETFDELNSLPYESCKKNADFFQLGVAKNVKQYNKEEAEKYGVVKEGEIREFNHLHLFLPSEYVDKSAKSVESIMGEYRDAKNVFKRGMDEIPLDTLNLVRDLITQGSLLDGQTHLYKVETMIKLMEEYDQLHPSLNDNWCWIKSYKFPLAKFKNELIGVLCSELAEGKELNAAVQAWNKRVDPANYMKATAPITKKQIEEAKVFVEDNGYTLSFDRRFATIDDIKVSEILHSNVGKGEIKSVSIFDGVKSTSTRHKRSEFDKVEEVSIEKFMKDILPGCTSVEAFLTNNQVGNLVSLTTSKHADSKPIFKWPNNYSWTYNGNLAGKSQLSQMVEAKGGRTDGAFRFTHSWNELEPNQSLMDLHVFMPGCEVPISGGGPNVVGRRVGWNQRQDALSGGTQDVDYTNAAPKGYVPVENITFPTLSKMPEGTYTCKIHNWSFRSTGGKGKAEIAFSGEVYQYIYPATRNHEWITIAEVTLQNGKFSIVHKIEPIDGYGTAKEVYGLETNNFHKVNLVCLSPNHWNNTNVGNKHYFFMLEGCKTTESIRSFHIENLIPELAAHRKVLEVLGTTNMINPTDKQLSGLGFNATVRDELVVRLSGTHKRVVKIKF